MNRAFYLVFAPAALVGIFYWQLGYRPSWRAVGGVAILLVLGLIVVQRQRRTKLAKAQTGSPGAPAGDTQEKEAGK